MDNVRTFAFVLFAAVGIAVVSGCRRESHHVLNWEERYQKGRLTILNGKWEDAENSWSELSKEGRQDGHLRQWIQMQIDILENTEADPLKSELRGVAMQEMDWRPDASLPHLAWLKKSSEAGVFKDKRVRRQAEKLIEKLETMQKRK
ncbi:hypothetical protein CfE428DRAFT_6651 [Chthoniobacter flavus Ellin428]|uniref:Lipoprotein n=1 Tax=Chthoniobacter flavus Ellin428 TaxID=497964 RepID=B4DCL0_9BACT|nr:hypothetical protein [Chthoniobacter flavus]EDY15824.1 hypothetical protein CfE428DRAFT_6651 [Chthoniobacter flavus Ellin428]TCO81865.1 hypothetical protein EV701_1526 [Chthoniobacter flavus]